MTDHNATLLLNHTPAPERLEEIAKSVAEEYFPDTEYDYTLAHELPQGTPVDVADQLTAQKNQTPDAIYFILRPKY